MKFKCIAFFIVLLFVKQVISQTITVNVVVPPPYSPRLEDYMGNNASTLIISLVNNSNATVRTKLRGKITGTNGVLIETSRNFSPAFPITLGALETRILSAGELGTMFSADNLDYSGVDKNEIIRTRIIPEGEYKFCVDAYNFDVAGYDPSNIISNSGSSLSCADINISYLEPPFVQTIGSIICGETLSNDAIDAMGPNQNFTVLWSIPAGSLPGTEYRITIVDVLPANRDPNDAINTATAPVFYETTTVNNFLICDNTVTKFIKGMKYAIRVQAYHPRQTYRNRGYGEVCSFVFGTGNGLNGGNGLTVSQIYPALNSTIPFNNIPIIIKWEPYNDNITQMNLNYRLQSGGADVEANNRNLQWPRGPLQTQRQVTGFNDLTQEQAQHLTVNRLNNDGTSATYYRRGKQYDFSLLAEARISGNARLLTGNVTGNFTTGMPVPQLQLPEHEKIVPPGEITFTFTTGNAPEHLLPPFAVTQASGNGGARFWNSNIEEKFIFMLSRNRDFSDSGLLETFGEGIGGNYDLLTADEASLKRELYKTVSHRFTINRPGKYYWKVIWLNNPRSEDKRNSYNHSPIFEFTVQGGDTLPRTPVRPTPASCIADCIASLPADRASNANLSVGQLLTFGKFRLTITALSNASAPYSGTGTIAIPFLGCRLRVNFTGIRANSELQVYAGTATAINDAPTIITPDLAQTGATYSGIPETTATEINRFLGTGNRLVSIITGANPEIGLPLGLDNSIGGIRNTIAIVGTTFTAERAVLNAVASFDFPELNGWLSLGATDICFHPNGLNAGEGKLYNPNEKRLVFSPDVQMVFTAPNMARRDSGTYVSWDCRGFKALHIKGEFRFSRNVFVPDSTSGAAGAGTVNARFHVIVNGLNNWLLALDMDPFQLTGLHDWGFAPRNIYFDFSSTRNFPNMVFPNGYNGIQNGGWKGFYMQSLEVRMPLQFRNLNAPGRRPSFGAYNMIIDRTGFSGQILGRNVLNINDGNIDGWAFGIDSVYMELVSNGFRRAGLVGDLKLPVASSPIDYRMVLLRANNGQFGYECVVQPHDTLRATIVNPAKLVLNPTSRIELIKQPGGEFTALGIIDGGIDITGRINPIGMIRFNGIRIEHLQIQNRAPYVECRGISFASPDKRMANMPVTLDSFRFVTAAGPGPGEFDQSPGFRVGLSMGVFVKLIENNNTFGGRTRLNFMAKVSPGSNSPMAVNFTGIKVEDVSVKGTIGPVSIEGGLQFYNQHAVYGEGIRGFINARFRPAISVQAIVQFGSINNNAYFYIDGSARITPSIPFIPGAMNIKGFGGAVYYGMRFENMRSPSEMGGSAPDINAIGATSTGATVVPSPGIAGFTARMYGVSPTGNTYKAMLELGASINTRTGGFSQLNINGDLIIMSETENPREAKVGAQVRLLFDFQRGIFDGRFDVWVDFNRVVRGRQANNRAGQMHIYADSSTWFIKIGRPDPANRIGLIFSLGRETSVNGYLMVGKQLDPIPALPPEITRLLRTVPASIRDPRVTGGDGFAFGAEFRDGLPKTNFLIFYAQLQYIIGFDVAVLRTPGVTCDNLRGAERGSDGWYAEGQIYGYFAGSIGIHVDVWFAQGDFEIFNAQLAAGIRGGFPNPNWFQGFIAGNYRILGGLVTGNFEYQVNIGERCVPPVDGPLNGFELVTQLSPANNEENVDVGVNPFAAFNVAPGHQDTISWEDGLGRRVHKTFRIMYKNYTLSGGTGNTIRQEIFNGPMQFASVEKTPDGKIIGMSPNEYLQARTSYTLSITGYIEYFENGTWVTALGRNGQRMERIYTNRFTTGDMPETIPDGDILTTYPFRGQRYLLQSECRNGYINCRRNPAPFFSNSLPNITRTYAVEWIATDGSAAPIRVAFNPRNVTGNTINFNIPTLQNNTTYYIKLIAINTWNNMPAGSGNGNKVSSNNSIQNAQVSRVVGNTRITINNIRAVRRNNVSFEEIIYGFYFRTSQFNTLQQKLESVRNITNRENRIMDVGDGMMRNFQINLFSAEGFDVFDAIGEYYRPVGVINGTATTGGLIQISHVPTNFDNEQRQNRIYNMFAMAANKRIVNSIYFNGIIPAFTPVCFAMSNKYGVDISNYRNKMRVDEYLPAPPAPFQASGFGNIPQATTLLYNGYYQAHFDKTILANAFVQIVNTPAMANYYRSQTTASDRNNIQQTIIERRYSGYPACQNLIFNAYFSLPISCFRDGGSSGTSYSLRTVYPGCGEAPR